MRRTKKSCGACSCRVRRHSTVWQEIQIVLASQEHVGSRIHLGLRVFPEEDVRGVVFPGQRRRAGGARDPLPDLYTDELSSADGGTVGPVFRARVGTREVEGLDLLRFDEQGKVRELTVMVRPRSALEALFAAVGSRLAAAGAV